MAHALATSRQWWRQRVSMACFLTGKGQFGAVRTTADFRISETVARNWFLLESAILLTCWRLLLLSFFCGFVWNLRMSMSITLVSMFYNQKLSAQLSELSQNYRKSPLLLYCEEMGWHFPFANMSPWVKVFRINPEFRILSHPQNVELGGL